MEGDCPHLENKQMAVYISIHTLRMEGDVGVQRAAIQKYEFQSTPSAWRVTVMIPYFILDDLVFQSTPSAWRVTMALRPNISSVLFQSTPSAWRVTGLYLYEDIRIEISIHTLRMEGDYIYHTVFYNRDISIHTLRMEGDRGEAGVRHRYRISIHTLRMEGDPWPPSGRPGQPDFNPHPPHGG